VADFTRAADLTHGADAWYHRANALLALKRHREAKQDYDRAIDLRPGHPAAHYGRAIARLGLGDAEGAERDLGDCLKLAPDHQEALQQRAMIRIGQSRLDEAEEDLVRALKISANAEWVGRLAALYAAKSDWTRAVTTYESALWLCHDDALRRTLEAELDRAKRERSGR
jgi:tetratricopeptide (TPR) repeat protein